MNWSFLLAGLDLVSFNNLLTGVGAGCTAVFFICDASIRLPGVHLVALLHMNCGLVKMYAFV